VTLEENPDTQVDMLISDSRPRLDELSEKGLVDKNHIVLSIYRIPCIMVPKGNPKNIRGLNDLLKPGMRLEIGDTDKLEIGRMTRIMLKRQKILAEYLKNVVLVRERSIINYRKYFKQDRLDAFITWTDIAMVNSKLWNADIDIVEITPEKAMYQLFYLRLATPATQDSDNEPPFL
jgi:molybdate transport system substrate-binding protein